MHHPVLFITIAVAKGLKSVTLIVFEILTILSNLTSIMYINKS